LRGNPSPFESVHCNRLAPMNGPTPRRSPTND
jgi:hypothetical protein